MVAPMRLEIALLLWMASMSGDEDDAARLGPMLAPPWQMAKSETPFPTGMTFETCDKLVDQLASRLHAAGGERTYSVSNRWGKILRAKLPEADGQSFTLVTCWGSDSSAQVAVALSRDGKTPYEF